MRDRRPVLALALLFAASVLAVIGGGLEIGANYRATLSSIRSENLALAETLASLAGQLERQSAEHAETNLTDLWTQVRATTGLASSFTLVGADGHVVVDSSGAEAEGADLKPMLVRGPSGDRTIGELLGAGDSLSGRTTTLRGASQIVGVAGLESGGAVIVATANRSVTSALLAATAPWAIVTGLAALVLVPISAVLLHRAYRGARSVAARRLAELDAIFESDAVGVAVLDRDLRYLRINNSLAAIDGSAVESMLGGTVRDRAPHIADRVEPILRSVLETGQMRTGVEVRLGGDGEAERVFSANYLPLRDDDGEIDAIAVIVLELTDLERAQEELRTTENIYQTVIETAREGVWTIDREDRTTFVNEQMTRMLGVSAESIMGRPLIDAFPEGAREEVMRNLEQRRSGVGEEHLLSFVRPDGVRVTLRFSTAPLTDASGRYAGAVALVTDLTEAGLAERLLQESEERFRALVRTQGDFVTRWRPDGTLLYANEAYCRQHGVERDDLVGSSFFPRIPKEDLERLENMLSRMTPGEPTYTIEHREQAADGRTSWLQWTDRGVFDNSGALVEVISVGRDITELREAETDLRSRERALAHAQRFAKFGTWRWVVGGDRAYWSDGQHRLYGLTPGEHEPTLEGWLSLVHPDDRQRCERAVAECVRRGEAGSIEFRVLRPDGAERVLQSSYEAISDNNGVVTEIIGATIDRTEQRLIEQLEGARTKALEGIASGADLDTTLHTIARSIEALVPDARVAIMRVENGVFATACSPNLHPAFVNTFIGARPARGMASCGAAVAENRRVIAEDVRTHPNWEGFRDAARDAGVRSCWSEPIRLGDDPPIGTVSLTFGEARRPTEEDLETLHTAAQLAGVAIRRLRDEQALAESEQRFRHLAESIDAVFWFAESPPLRVRYVSPGFERVWGRTPEQIYAEPWIWNEAIHEEDRPRVRAVFERWLTSDEPGEYSEEYRIVRPDGEIRWIRDKGAALPGGPDGRRRVAGLAEDITARKERELLLADLNKQLVRHRNMLEATLGSASDLIFLYDARGAFNYLNPAALRLFSASMDELRGKRVEDLGYPMDLIGGFVERRQRVLRDGVAEHGESQFPVNGDIREFDYVLNPVFDAEGRVVGAVASARDVSEQREAARELRRALQQLAFHMENTPLAIVEWDAEVRVVRWSPRAEELFGWKSEEVLGKAWSEWFIHPEDQAKVAGAVRRLVDRVEERNSCTNRNLTKDGRVLHCQWYNSVLFDEDGELVSVLSLGQDITDRVHAEERLRDSEERLRLALDASTDGIWEWTVATGEVVWSDRVYEIFGLDRAATSPSIELVRSLVHPDDERAWDEAIEAHLERGAPFDNESRFRRGDGACVWLRTVGQAVRDEGGAPVRLVGSVSDITPRREAAEALERAKEELEQRVRERTRELVDAHEATARSEARFRSIFENSGVGVVLADADGRLIQANPAFDRMVLRGQRGASANGDLERPAWDLVRAACPMLDEVLADREASLQDEVQVRGEAGEATWLRLTAQTVRGGPNDRDGAVVIVEDVTERRRAQETAKARLNDLAHAARLITAGELAAGLAHELNQPLAAISAYADGAARRLSAEDGSPDTMQLLGKIGDQARRAGQIIHRLKDLVRKQTPRRAACRLDVLLHETLELVAPTAEARGVEISVGSPPDLPRIEVDWVQLQQVFLNLLTNALEAVSDAPMDNRWIRVEARHTAEEGEVRVIIEDSGPGLAGVDPERLFESFYSTKTKGMGLGLPISRSIIEAHHGRLWCESGEGHGARFVLIMPCVRGEVAANG